MGLKTFNVRFHGRKRRPFGGGRTGDFRLTVEASDQHEAERQVRDAWDVFHSLSITETP